MKLKKIAMALLLTMTLATVTACTSSSTTGTDSMAETTVTEETAATEEAETTEETETTGEAETTEETEATDTAEEGEVSEMLKKLREKGTLTVGSSGDLYAYIDEDTKEFSGIDAVIIKEAARRLGIEKVEMSLIPFSELILNLNSGNIDMITDGMYIRTDRAQQIHYGEVWYTQGGALVVATDSAIKGVADFDPAGTTVGFTTGTVCQAVVEKWESDGLIKEAVATGDQTESLVALQYGKIDVFLTDSPIIEDLFTNSPEIVEGLRLCEGFEDTDDTLGHIAPSVAFGNEDFMEEVNAVIYEMREDGFIKQAFIDCGLNPDNYMITNDEADRKWFPAE